MIGLRSFAPRPSQLLNLLNWKKFFSSYRRPSTSTPSASESCWLTVPTVQSGGGDPKKVELARVIADGHGLFLVPFRRRDSGYVEVLGVLQLNVCAKRFIERFISLLPSVPDGI
jgi:hypothetical protein